MHACSFAWSCSSVGGRSGAPGGIVMAAVSVAPSSAVSRGGDLYSRDESMRLGALHAGVVEAREAGEVVEQRSGERVREGELALQAGRRTVVDQRLQRAGRRRHTDAPHVLGAQLRVPGAQLAHRRDGSLERVAAGMELDREPVRDGRRVACGVHA
jgi:hypothetical protein